MIERVQPLVSVLMVNYNHERLLQESIESVLAQSYGNIQFIIVDDGSSDSSVEIIQAYMKKDPRIELYVTSKNRHICHATNLGFRKIKGDYVARIDSDDLWKPDKLERQLAFMRETPNCDICFTGADLIDEDGTNINEKEKDFFGLLNQEQKSHEDTVRYFFLHGNFLTHASVLMKRSVRDETGDFILGYRQIHDYEYWVRIAKKHQLYMINEQLTCLRRFTHSDRLNNSSTTETDTLRYNNERIMMLRTYFDGLPNDLFCKAFRDLFRDPDAYLPQELECEKAFLLLDHVRMDGEQYSILGVMRLEELLENPEMAEVLENKYGYTPICFYEDAKKKIFATGLLDEMEKKLRKERYYLGRERRRHQEEVEALRGEIEALSLNYAELFKSREWYRRSLEIVVESASWRITKPVRAVLDAWKQLRHQD